MKVGSYMKKLEGKISIGRITSNIRTEDYVSITVTDKNSGCEAISATMELKQFAQAITGLGHVDCTFEFNDSGMIGKTRELTRSNIAP